MMIVAESMIAGFIGVAICPMFCVMAMRSRIKLERNYYLFSAFFWLLFGCNSLTMMAQRMWPENVQRAISITYLALTVVFAIVTLIFAIQQQRRIAASRR
jgi:hypothetical protein